MERELGAHLLAVCDAYCAATNAAKSTVAQSACGDWRFFDRVEGGASFTVRTYDKALKWFSERWPAHVDWPVSVARPAAISTDLAHDGAAA